MPKSLENILNSIKKEHPTKEQIFIQEADAINEIYQYCDNMNGFSSRLRTYHGQFVGIQVYETITGRNLSFDIEFKRYSPVKTKLVKTNYQRYGTGIFTEELYFNTSRNISSRTYDDADLSYELCSANWKLFVDAFHDKMLEIKGESAKRDKKKNLTVMKNRSVIKRAVAEVSEDLEVVWGDNKWAEKRLSDVAIKHKKNTRVSYIMRNKTAKDREKINDPEYMKAVAEWILKLANVPDLEVQEVSSSDLQIGSYITTYKR